MTHGEGTFDSILGNTEHSHRAVGKLSSLILIIRLQGASSQAASSKKTRPPASARANNAPDRLIRSGPSHCCAGVGMGAELSTSAGQPGTNHIEFAVLCVPRESLSELHLMEVGVQLPLLLHALGAAFKTEQIARMDCLSRERVAQRKLRCIASFRLRQRRTGQRSQQLSSRRQTPCVFHVSSPCTRSPSWKVLTP